MEFGTRIHLNPSNDRGEFELDRERSKNNIEKYLFALGHETHNTMTNYMLKTTSIADSRSFFDDNP